MEKGYWKEEQVLKEYRIYDKEHKDENGNLMYIEHIKEPVYEMKETFVEYTQKELNEMEIDELKQELSTYNYIGVKIAMGVATKEEYADKIAYTEELRAKIRVLGG